MTSSNIYFIRNGEPEDRRYQHNATSPLSSLGVRQAERMAIQLQDIPWDLVISSTAPHCVKTAEIIGRIKNPSQPILPMDTLDILPEEADAVTFAEASAILGIASLRAYRSQPAVREALERYARVAKVIISNVVIDNRRPKNMLVVGRGVLLQAIASKFASDSRIESTVLGYASGFGILTSGRVLLIER